VDELLIVAAGNSLIKQSHAWYRTALEEMIQSPPGGNRDPCCPGRSARRLRVRDGAGMGSSTRARPSPEVLWPAVNAR